MLPGQQQLGEVSVEEGEREPTEHPVETATTTVSGMTEGLRRRKVHLASTGPVSLVLAVVLPESKRKRKGEGERGGCTVLGIPFSLAMTIEPLKSFCMCMPILC